MGEKNIISVDNPTSVPKLNIDNDAINIVHVHGTYEFYDCCNLSWEITERANEDGFFTIKSFLTNVLSNMSPIIIGYSGWEKYIIVNVLKERLKMPLKHKLYWFCYSKESFENIPQSIKELGNDDIVFVLPNGIKSLESTDDNAQMNNIFDEKLEATKIFNKMISEFNIGVPDILENPIEFFKKYYKKTLGPSLYNQLLLSGFSKYEKVTNQEVISRLKGYVLSGNIKALEIECDIDKISSNCYSDEDLREILICLLIVVKEGNNKLHVIIDNYIKIYELLRDKTDDDKLAIARVHIKKLILSEDLNLECIDKIYNEIIHILIKKDNDDAAAIMFDILRLKLKEINKKDDMNARMQLYNELIYRFNDMKNDIYIQIVNFSKVAKVNIMRLEDDFDKNEALKLLEDVLLTSTDVENSNIIVCAMMDKAEITSEIDKIQAEKQYSKIIKTYENNKKMRRHVLDAEYKKAKLIYKRDTEEAKSYYRHILNKYRNIDNDLEDLVYIKYELANILKEDNVEEAKEIYSEIINTYDINKSKRIKTIVIESILAFTQLTEDDIKRISIFENVINKYKDQNDILIRNFVANIMISRVYDLLIVNEKQKAIEACEDIIDVYKDDEDNAIKSIILEAEIIKLLNKYDDKNIKIKNIIKFYEKNVQDSIFIELTNALLRNVKFYNLEEEEEMKKLYSVIIKKCKDIKYKVDENQKEKIINIYIECLIGNIELTNDISKKTLYDEYNKEKVNYTGKEKRINRLMDYLKIHMYIYYQNTKNKELIELLKNTMKNYKDNINDKNFFLNKFTTQAFKLYENKKFIDSAKYFYLSYILDKAYGVNLAYMIRRKQIKDIEEYPTCEEMLYNIIDTEEDLVFINYALFCLEKGNIDEALENISKVNSEESFSWWLELEDTDEEKYIVMYLASIVNKLKFSEMEIKKIETKIKSSYIKDLYPLERKLSI